MQRSTLRVLAAAGSIAAATATGCTPDAPTHDKAVAVISRACDEHEVLVARLGLPTDVFALSEIARQAFELASKGMSELDAAGLAAMDSDGPVQRYRSAVVAMNNAFAELSRSAAFEDLPGMEAALNEAERVAAELDAAAAELGLRPECGGPAWRGGVVDDARTVVAIEKDLMTPTGNYVADVSTYCSRYARRLGLAPEPGTPAADRQFALVAHRATSQLGHRLASLPPPADAPDAHAVLVQALDDVTHRLEPSETLAIDGSAAELRTLVAAVRTDLDAIDDLLAGTGALC
jgi:hypothetical protein